MVKSMFLRGPLALTSMLTIFSAVVCAQAPSALDGPKYSETAKWISDNLPKLYYFSPEGAWDIRYTLISMESCQLRYEERRHHTYQDPDVRSQTFSVDLSKVKVKYRPSIHEPQIDFETADGTLRGGFFFISETAYGPDGLPGRLANAFTHAVELCTPQAKPKVKHEPF